ncbi:VWA domain-containing protein [Parafilimonas sp.]|uniref:VWA domain-containing protein n=1 Tax=Parafilimonas sp. TaxID=1969739 RepID=UPI0039E60ACA
MFQFEHPAYLTGLVIIIPLALLLFSVLQWKKKVKKALGDEKLINQLTKNYDDKKYKLKFILIATSILLLIIAAANLRKPVVGKEEKRAGIDIMIALDVSKSMWAEDVKPSRLDAAKQFVNNLIDKLDDNRVGLVVFAGRAVLQMPLTSDFAVSKLYVSNASPEAAPVQGTVVGDALRLCAGSFNSEEKKYKAVVLISDGEDHDPGSEAILQQLSDNGIIVNTVGVGSVNGAPIMEPGTNAYKVDRNGQTIISKLNEEELRKIAQQTGGAYFHLDNAGSSPSNIAAILDGMEKKAIETGGGEKQYSSLYSVFVLMALLLLVAEIFIPETKRKIQAS